MYIKLVSTIKFYEQLTLQYQWLDMYSWTIFINNGVIVIFLCHDCVIHVTRSRPVFPPSSGCDINRPNNAQTPPTITQGRACYECGDPNHFRNQCPKLIIVNQGARGRAFNINANEAQANNDVVNGTFLVNNHYASIMFDTGADRSFVNFKFEPLLTNSN